MLAQRLIYFSPLSARTYLVTSLRFFLSSAFWLFIDGARLKSGRGGPAKRVASEFVNDFSSDRLILRFTAICQPSEKDACTRGCCTMFFFSFFSTYFYFFGFLGFYADPLTCESVLASVEFINLTLRSLRF